MPRGLPHAQGRPLVLLCSFQLQRGLLFYARRIPRDVPASPVELPEWQACLGACRVRFRRPQGHKALARYTTGRLTAWPHKHGDTRARAVPGRSAQRRQACLTTLPWEEEALPRPRVRRMIAAAARGDGGRVFDERGFPTPGTASVGGARQAAGTLGKVGHGQIAATCCATDRPATWPVAGRLDWPQAWAQAPARRHQGRGPAEGACQTEPERALLRLEQARAWRPGRHHRWSRGERRSR